jgi:hypothetical protein
MTEEHRHKSAQYIKPSLLMLLFIGFLFIGFYRNQWRVVDQAWFQNFQRDTESQILGRLVKSRQDGIFSSGGLTGMGNGSSIEAQYIAYFKNEPFNSFQPYLSQIGFQGMLFSMIDKVSPLDSGNNFRVFRGMTSLLSAIAFSAIILWFYNQFGLFTAVVAFLTTLFSQWLTLFSRNLWWSTWAFYLPMIICMYILAFEERNGKFSDLVLTGLVSLGVFSKCLFNGYEYITTTLVMLAVPLAYYAIRNRWSIWEFLKRVVLVQFGSVLSILTSMAILAYQLSFIEGSFSEGVKYILYTFGKRSYGDPAIYPELVQESLKADVFPVVMQYFDGVVINLNNLIRTPHEWLSDLFEIRFDELFYLFLAFTLMALLSIRSLQKTSLAREKTLALIGATWFAILAPLSWFTIFKSHSYIHTHMNYITWHMPFTLFGFALIGLATKQTFSRLVNLNQK